jgi:hypothetical protein
MKKGGERRKEGGKGGEELNPTVSRHTLHSFLSVIHLFVNRKVHVMVDTVTIVTLLKFSDGI